jgi:hypothetical protein
LSVALLARLSSVEGVVERGEPNKEIERRLVFRPSARTAWPRGAVAVLRRFLLREQRDYP